MIEIDLDDIPTEYNWIAVDNDGELYAYQNKPCITEYDIWDAEEGDALYIKEISAEGWRDSLTRRPGAAQEFPQHEENETYKAFDYDVAMKDRTVDEIAAENARSLVGSVSELVQQYRAILAELSMLKASLRELSHE